MTGDVSDNIEIKLLEYLEDITSIVDPERLLQYIVDEIPHVLNVRRCSIYLLPEFVPKYTGKLINSDHEEIKAETLQKSFIVLAQTNYPDKQHYIGQLFYPTGEDLTGWVFEHGNSLRLKNSRDIKELQAIDPDLILSTRYKLLEQDDHPEEIRPVLYVPLRSDSKIIGVFKLHKPQPNLIFDDRSEQIANIIAHVVAEVLYKNQIMSERERIIFELAELGSKEQLDEVFNSITNQMMVLLNSPKCQFYERDETNTTIKLTYENGKKYDSKKNFIYTKDKGLIGWVFKTGKPLIVDDTRDFIDEVELTDELLKIYSDGSEINDEDRKIIAFHANFISKIDRPFPFIAVPVILKDGSVWGVLCAHFVVYMRRKNIKPFNRNELLQLKAFAAIIAFAYNNDLVKRKNDLLLKLGRCWNLDAAFKIVTNYLPSLVNAPYCYIFQYNKDVDNNSIQFRACNRGGQVQFGYNIGEGKTGFCAQTESVFIISHFGKGQLNSKKISERKEVIKKRYPQDLVDDLLDENYNCIGIIQLWEGAKLSMKDQHDFFQMKETQKIHMGHGLPSPRIAQYLAGNAGHSYSFAAVPIRHESGELGGVLTVSRPVEQNPFSGEDINFLVSIAGTLASIIDNTKMQKQQTELILTLAHEINTPLTGLLADAENLVVETTLLTVINKISNHLKVQVNQLIMMTETIMTVITGGVQNREFTTHSIFKPLISAVEMFKEEAIYKGCEIQPPVTIDGSSFPKIDMDLFYLTIAIKNIIHNAVKYSFKPSKDQEKNRFIKIEGYWEDQDHQYYSISIQNYGVGITQEEIDKRKLFIPYYRGIFSSDQRRTGAGFGLSYASKIIEELHHGKIDVESIPMGGQAYLTTFTIILPVEQTIRPIKKEK